jgi:hypothetical protein
MIIDATFDFGLPAHTDAGTVVSTNVYDAGAGSAVNRILFQAGQGMRIWGRQALTGSGSAYTLRCDFVAGDTSDLDPDFSEAGETDVLACSPMFQTADDGTDLVTGDTVEFNFDVTRQTTARRWYGLHSVLGGSSTPTAAAGDAYGVFDAQTNMIGAQAAVPAT